MSRNIPAALSAQSLTSETTRVLLGTAISIFLRDAERAAKISGQLPGRQRAIGARWVVSVDEQDFPVYVRTRDDGYDIMHERDVISVHTSWRLGRRLFQAIINGKLVSVKIRPLDEGFRLLHGGADTVVKVRSPRVAELAAYMPKYQADISKDKLTAPIAGLIVSIKVAEGEPVKVGQELLVLEAMKMENVITAEHEGVVKKIHVSDKDSVQVDQLLMEFSPPEA